MQIIGHKSQLEQLRHAAREGKLAHAYLFAGLEGIGKKLVAKVFTMELLCENGCCLSCKSCLTIQNNTHPDVFTIVAEKKDISIEQMRGMQAQIQMHTMESPYRIVVIDDAEKMNASAANSALKTLEEPPPSTHIFVITARPHLLLPTIISRCQRVSFSPLPIEEVASYIQKANGVDYDTAGVLAAVSGGSLGLALAFPADIADSVPPLIANLWRNPKASEVLSLAEQWADGSPEGVLALLLCVYRDILVSQSSGGDRVFKKISGQIDLAAKKYSNQAIQAKIAAIQTAQYDLDFTYNKQLMFEQLLFKMVSP